MVGEGRAHWSTDVRTAHGSDETEDLVFMPDVVLEPESTAEVSAILSWAHDHGVPVTAAGARTGLSGGATAALHISGELAAESFSGISTERIEAQRPRVSSF